MESTQTTPTSPATSPTLAAQHADPSMGFNAVPRWFRRTDFWRGLTPTHRCIVDELYHRICRLPHTHKGYGIELLRGQWVTSMEELAKATGATRTTTRRAIANAAKASVIKISIVITAKRAGAANPISLITWLDFDSYDSPNNATGQSTGQSPGQSSGQWSGQGTGQQEYTVTIHGTEDTGNEDTEGIPGLEEIGAAPQPVTCVPGTLPAPPGGTSLGAEGNTTPSATSNRRKQGARVTTATRKGTKLSDDQIKLVQTDLLSLCGYYLHGQCAIGLPQAQWAVFGPAPTNWAPKGRDYGRPEPDIKPAALAAYVWCRLMAARISLKQPHLLTLANMGWLLGTIKNVRKSLTQDQLIARVDCIGNRWPEILDVLAWMASPPIPNESTLGNAKIMEAVERLLRGENIATAPAKAAAGSSTSPELTEFSKSLSQRKYTLIP